MNKGELARLAKEIITVDFETEAIGPRPKEYPPQPVGVAIRWPSGESAYFAWQHPGDSNNTTIGPAKNLLSKIWNHPLLFHNGRFDIEVAMRWLEMGWPSHWHDTLFLAYLANPNSKDLGLKPLAEEYLSQPPTERDALVAAIMARVPKATDRDAMAYVSEMPGPVVAPYAIGDVERTYKLFCVLSPRVLLDDYDSMWTAYKREILLTPHLLAAERRGIPVNRALLNDWKVGLADTIARCDVSIQSRLHNKKLNVDSGDELADALLAMGLASRDKPWPETPTGKRSTARAALTKVCSDPALVGKLVYRNTAATMLRTFVDPWLTMSKADGRLHTTWHQVRGMETNGTRTGRIASSNPNLSNPPKSSSAEPPHDFYILPELRKALLPEDGHVWVAADYNSQELRIAAHYENGPMAAGYRDNPNLDLHAWAAERIESLTNVVVTRQQAKIIGFLLIYGGGAASLAEMLGINLLQAALFKEAYFEAFPFLQQAINRAMEASSEKGFVTTIGRRKMPVQLPSIDKGVRRYWHYKAFNAAVQGGAADMTKQAIIDFCSLGLPEVYLSVQLYDEIGLSVPRGIATEVTERLCGIMEKAIPLNVPMIATAKIGVNWGDARDEWFRK